MGGFVVYAFREEIMHLSLAVEGSKLNVVFFLSCLISFSVLIVLVANLHKILQHTRVGIKHKQLLTLFSQRTKANFARELQIMNLINLTMGAGLFDFVTLIYSGFLEVRTSMLILPAIVSSIRKDRQEVRNEDLSLEDRIYRASLNSAAMFSKFYLFWYLACMGFIITVFLLAFVNFSEIMQVITLLTYGAPLIIALIYLIGMKQNEEGRVPKLLICSMICFPILGTYLTFTYDKANALICNSFVPLQKMQNILAACDLEHSPLSMTFSQAIGILKVYMKIIFGGLLLLGFFTGIPKMLGAKADFNNRYLKWYFFERFARLLISFMVYIAFPFIIIVFTAFVFTASQSSIQVFIVDWVMLFLFFLPLIIVFVGFLVDKGLRGSVDNAYQEKTGAPVPNFLRYQSKTKTVNRWFLFNKYLKIGHLLVVGILVCSFLAYGFYKTHELNTRRRHCNKKASSLGLKRKGGQLVLDKSKREMIQDRSESYIPEYLDVLNTSKYAMLKSGVVSAINAFNTEDFSKIKPVLIKTLRNENEFTIVRVDAALVLTVRDGKNALPYFMDIKKSSKNKKLIEVLDSFIESLEKEK